MRPPSWPDAAGEILERLAELFEVEPLVVVPEPPGDDELAVAIGPHRFVIHYERSSRLPALLNAIERLRPKLGHGPVPIVAVPFMSKPGHERCKAAGLSWLDLCGNGRVRSSNFTCRVAGRPDRFRGDARPPTAFAPRSSRIARHLLVEPERAFTQRELTSLTGLSEGLVSRVVRRLEADGLVERDERGALRAHSPALLLDAWWESYDFARHDVLRGHVPARDGLELFRSLAKELAGHHVDYAATGLGAAWLLNKFVGFNTATFYVRTWPTKDFLAAVGFRTAAPASNVWLVRPNDEGVYHGALELERVRCVHPVQAFLDLKGQPERAPEAAARLRRETLKWMPPDA